MAPETRTIREEAFKRFLLQACKFEDGDDAVLALRIMGVTEVDHLLDTPYNKLGELFTPEVDGDGDPIRGSKKDLPPWKISRLRYARQFLRGRNTTQGPTTSLSAAILDAIDPGEFNEHRVTQLLVDDTSISSPSSSRAGFSGGTGAANAPAVVTPEMKELAEFRKGTKRDMTVFPVLKEEQSYESYVRTLQSIAKAQGVGDVLDRSFVIPRHPDLKKLFEEKQVFMYAVFNTTIRTSIGQTFVREHSHDFNARMVFEKLDDHYTKSTTAGYTKIDLLGKVTGGLKLDENWKSSTQGFVLHWKECMRKYEEVAPSSEHIHDDLKRLMIQNAVYQSDELRRVQQVEDNSVAAGSPKSDYEQYMKLLISAATAHDKATGTHSSRRSRLVNMVDLDTPTEFFTNDGEEARYMANRTSVQGSSNVSDDHQGSYTVNRTYIPPHLWKEVCKCDELREFLMKDGFSNSPVRGLPENRNDAKNKARVNRHETDPKDYGEQDDDAFVDASQDESQVFDDDDPNPLLADLTKQKRMNPKDLRAVLSPPPNRRRAKGIADKKNDLPRGEEFEIKFNDGSTR